MPNNSRLWSGDTTVWYVCTMDVCWPRPNLEFGFKFLAYPLRSNVPGLNSPLLSKIYADPEFLQSVLWRAVHSCPGLPLHRDSSQRQIVRPSYTLVLDRHQMGRFQNRSLLCSSVASNPPPSANISFLLTEFQVLHPDLLLYLRPRGT